LLLVSLSARDASRLETAELKFYTRAGDLSCTLCLALQVCKITEFSARATTELLRQEIIIMSRQFLRRRNAVTDLRALKRQTFLRPTWGHSYQIGPNRRYLLSKSGSFDKVQIEDHVKKIIYGRIWFQLVLSLPL